MKHIKYLLVAGLAIFLLSCNVLQLQGNSELTIQFDSFKGKHHYKTDAECLQHLLSILPAGETVIIDFSDRVYEFNKMIRVVDFNSHLILQGKEETKFRGHEGILEIQVKSIPVKLRQSAFRGSQHVFLDNVNTRITTLTFISDQIVETAWGSKANDIVRLHRREGMGFKLMDSLHFNYKLEHSKVEGLYPASLRIKNIQFDRENSPNCMLRMSGIHVEMHNCDFTSNNIRPAGTFVELYQCIPVIIENIRMAGAVNYGFLINRSRDIHFQDITSQGCIHPITTGTWSSDIRVEGLYCRGSVIDSHPSINVSYKDVTIENGQDYWNCRALGIHLENCKFQVEAHVRNRSLYLGLVALTKEFEFLYSEYDVFCKNVEWIHEDLDFNGLHVHQCRKFRVEDCITHAVSTGSTVEEFQVIRSRIGRVYGSDSNFSVRQCVFDADLQSRERPLPPLSGSYSGTVSVSNCQFNGYQDTYLFRYIQSSETTVLIRDSELSDFIGFAENSYLSPTMYMNIMIENAVTSMKVRDAFAPFASIKYLTKDE